jgi:hypothetical protein
MNNDAVHLGGTQMKKTLLLSILLVIVAFSVAAPAQTVARTSAVYIREYSTATFSALSATGAGATFDINGIQPRHGVSYTVTGAPATCTIDLEASLDGVFWVKIITGTVCTSSIYASVVDKPFRYIRPNLITLTGGTTPAVTAKYAGSR